MVICGLRQGFVKNASRNSIWNSLSSFFQNSFRNILLDSITYSFWVFPRTPSGILTKIPLEIFSSIVSRICCGNSSRFFTRVIHGLYRTLRRFSSWVPLDFFQASFRNSSREFLNESLIIQGLFQYFFPDL